MSHQHFVLWQNNRRLTSFVVGAVFLITAVPAFAQFKPRDREPATGHTRGRGTRGCGSKGGIPATQLAPQTFVGETASTRPMLAWYMSSSQNVRFRLFEFDSPKSDNLKIIGEFKEIPTTIGINKLKLPLDYPELTVGKKYLWQIAIDCDSNTIVNHAEFIVINPPSHAKNQFTSIPESVNYYAQKGLWYEAFEEALKSIGNGKLGQTGANLIKELAQSEILTGDEEDIQYIQRRIENLQKISSDLAIANQK